MTERTPQRAYLDLQKLARDQGRNTQQLFELYIHERFLARVAEAQYADKLVLKGGMLLAVLDVRRGTRDADMLARGLAGDESGLKAVIGEIASIPMTSSAPPGQRSHLGMRTVTRCYPAACDMRRNAAASACADA